VKGSKVYCLLLASESNRGGIRFGEDPDNKTLKVVTSSLCTSRFSWDRNTVSSVPNMRCVSCTAIRTPLWA